VGELSRAAARKAFQAARVEARSALACLVEAPPGWDVECRLDANRAIAAMMTAAQTTAEILEVVSLRGLLLQSGPKSTRKPP
jgi:hypothetical protein